MKIRYDDTGAESGYMPAADLENLGTGFTAAAVAVLLVTSPGALPAWVQRKLAEGRGYGRHTLPPGTLARGGCCSALPSQVAREVHYRLCVHQLSWLVSFDRLHEVNNQPTAAFCLYGTPLLWLVVLPFCLLADGALMAVLGVLSTAEVAWFAFRYAVFTPAQMRQRAAKVLDDLARKGDPRGFRFDDQGRCLDFPAQLYVPTVNSFSLAASFLLTLLILWIEVFNLVEDVEGERDRHICYVLLGVQFCLSGLAQVLATSAMDRRDETYIYALQSAGSVSAGGPFVGRLESIRVASTVDAVDLQGSCGRKGTLHGAAFPCPVVFCGGSLNFVIAYRGRSGYAGQDLGRVNPADPVVAFVATLVILLCNVLW